MMGIYKELQCPKVIYELAIYFTPIIVSFFVGATTEEWGQVKFNLGKYEREAGQVVNNNKSFINFSKNTTSSAKQSVLQAMGSSICRNYDKYIDSSTFVRRSKYNSFRWIKEKVWQRINTRKNKLLSQAKREIFIKLVLQAILVYTMSVYHLPHKLCLEIAPPMGQYW